MRTARIIRAICITGFFMLVALAVIFLDDKKMERVALSALLVQMMIKALGSARLW